MNRLISFVKKNFRQPTWAQMQAVLILIAQGTVGAIVAMFGLGFLSVVDPVYVGQSRWEFYYTSMAMIWAVFITALPYRRLPTLSFAVVITTGFLLILITGINLFYIILTAAVAAIFVILNRVVGIDDMWSY